LHIEFVADDGQRRGAKPLFFDIADGRVGTPSKGDIAMAFANPQTWEGNFALVETKQGSGVFTLKPRPTGKYSAENLDDVIAAVLKAKVKLDGWKVWADGDVDVNLPKGEPVTHTKLAKLAKEADHVQLAFVKRPFPQPKLRFVKGEGSRPAKAASNLREL